MKTGLNYEKFNPVIFNLHTLRESVFKFFNLTLQQINDTLDNKIVSGKILSSDKFIVNNYKALKGSIELQKEISPKFKWIKNDTLKNQIQNKLEIKKAKLYEIQNHNFNEKCFDPYKTRVIF
ncbi:hypothetical protein JL193_00990 [Polaribacter batillariae]|uniref:Uncharacterized protein n=1 Tax=Polaribacter batillariae TaxID=2808900 RepID=A0ABX7SUS7_9FLAO|nr:hypothetical protein [Polaribacter batillariae]QTD37916.1 hypothetical protein JL193_00990 [Polaribacter batillariae]